MEFPIPVTIALVQALAVQVELELRDVDQDIEEMADLCDELLSSDISIRSVTIPIMDFAKAISLHFKCHLEWKIRSSNVTDCLRKAILHLPDLHQVTMLLAQSLHDRFVVAPSDDHYNVAMTILDTVLMFRGSGDKPSPYREQALKRAALLADTRFDAYGKPEHLEHAIYRFRAWLDGTAIEDPDRVEIIENLSRLKGLRLDGTANDQDVLSVPLERVESAMLPSFPDLIVPFPEVKTTKPNSTVTFGGHLDALRTCRDNQHTHVADIEEDVKYCRHLIVSYPRSEVASAAQATLCKLLYRIFQYTHKIVYLNEAISANRHGINTANSFHSRSPYLSGLFHCYQPVSGCYLKKKTCMNSCNSTPLWLIMASGVHMLSSPAHLIGRQLHAVLDIPLPPPRMTMPCRCSRPLSHLLRHLTNSIPGSSKRVVISKSFRCTTHPIRFILVTSRRLSRPSNGEEDCCGQKCAAFEPHSIKFASPTPV